HAGAQHQPVRGNLGFLGNVAQHRQEVAGKAHGNSEKRDFDSRASLMPTQSPSVHSMQACKLCRIYLAEPISVVRVRANKTKGGPNRRTSTTSREERWQPLHRAPKTSVLSNELNSAGPRALLFCCPTAAR